MNWKEKFIQKKQTRNDTLTFKNDKVLKSHSEPVTAVQLDSSGDLLFTGSFDCTVKSKCPSLPLPLPNKPIPTIQSYTNNVFLVVWDTTRPAVMFSIAAHRDIVSCLQFLGDRFSVTQLFTGSWDNTVKVSKDSMPLSFLILSLF